MFKFLRPGAGYAHASACLAVLLGAASLPAGAHAAQPEKESAPVFESYQVWRDEPLQDWREANQRVREIGGWRTYARELEAASEAESQPAVPDSSPSGHHAH